MTYTASNGETYADLNGDDVRRAEPDVERCYFCLNPATTSAAIGPEEDARVCGLHS